MLCHLLLQRPGGNQTRKSFVTSSGSIVNACSLTCDLASSTSIFAAGCVTVILFKIVAPSLVIITSPSAWHTCMEQTANACRKQGQHVCTALDQTTHHLVHSSGTETRSDSIGNSLCSFDVIDSYIFLLGVLTALHRHVYGKLGTISQVAQHFGVSYL